jgi:hypothetical protein
VDKNLSSMLCKDFLHAGYSIRVSYFLSSHFIFAVIRDISISIVIHCQINAANVRYNCFSTCTISTMSLYYSFVISIADDKIITLFMDNHIHWSIQLIISISQSISTGHYLTTCRTTLPFHNTMI